MPTFYWVFELANNVGNIYTAKAPKVQKEKFVSKRKRSTVMDPGSCRGYTFKLIHLFFKNERHLDVFLLLFIYVRNGCT